MGLGGRRGVVRGAVWGVGLMVAGLTAVGCGDDNPPAPGTWIAFSRAVRERDHRLLVHVLRIIPTVHSGESRDSASDQSIEESCPSGHLTITASETTTTP